MPYPVLVFVYYRCVQTKNMVESIRVDVVVIENFILNGVVFLLCMIFFDTMGIYLRYLFIPL